MTDSRIPLPDQEIRDRIAQDLRTTMLVEAAAGTGKTTCLITRMVALLRAGACPIETLAAVTFTRKAAAELRSRFHLQLEQQAEGCTGAERARLREAHAHVEQCFIGTIHAFCTRLLRERPVEAGLDPGFTELEEAADQLLREQAWREYVATLIANDDPVLPELERLGLKVSPSTLQSSPVRELDELGLEPAELGPAFLKFAEYRDVTDWPASETYLPDLAPCREALRAYVTHIEQLDLPLDPGNDRILRNYHQIARMSRQLDLQRPADLMKVLEQFRHYQSRSIVNRRWPGKKRQAEEELERWTHFTSQHAEPWLTRWREHRYAVALRVLRGAAEHYDRMRAASNALNFQDLLQRSAALLREHPQVRRNFRHRFTHLLVDEFQDTDPLQAEVMLLLTADDVAQTDWQRCRPKPGSLFVVGDPKQSIYRFRRADIVTYNKVRDILEQSGGLIARLSANFRSRAGVVEWVNGCFAQLFPPQADRYSPAHHPLRVGRVDTADSAQLAPVVHLHVPEHVHKTPARTAEFEAAHIARTIRRAVDECWQVPRPHDELCRGRPSFAQPGDFLIITRTRAQLSTFADALQHQELPHEVTGGTVLNEVPELVLLQLCLQAAVHRDDPVALVAVLRSELFGIADPILYDLRQLGGRFRIDAELPDGLDADASCALRDAFARLRIYSHWLQAMPPAAALERIAADLGLLARASAQPHGSMRAGSLLKAIELLRMSPATLTPENVLEGLCRLIDATDKHDGMAVRPATESPVRVMNLHQAKGLEAPFVFLAGAFGQREYDVDVHIDRETRSPRGFLTIRGRGFTRNGFTSSGPLLAHPRDWQSLAEEEQRFLHAEARRLLYVAATRAGVQLVISQRSPNHNASNPWQLFEPHLRNVPALEDVNPPIQKLAREATDTAIPREAEASGARRAASPMTRQARSSHLSAIATRWKSIAEPTYAVEAVKDLALREHGGRAAKPRGAASRSAEWGTVLHGLLEVAMQNPKADLRSLALTLLHENELSVDLLEDALTTTDRVLDSDLWSRARHSSLYLTEVPLTVPQPMSNSAGELPTILRGVIDLVFREPEGWVIVDYKSERVDADAIPALAAYYRPQLAAYAALWAEVTSDTVHECGLFFAHLGRYVTISRP